MCRHGSTLGLRYSSRHTEHDSWSDSFFSACLTALLDLSVAVFAEGFMLLSAILLLMCGFCHKACNVTYTAIHCVMLCHLVKFYTNTVIILMQCMCMTHHNLCVSCCEPNTCHFMYTYLPTILEFPGIYRKIGFHPGIPEILYNSRISRRRPGGRCGYVVLDP